MLIATITALMLIFGGGMSTRLNGCEKHSYEAEIAGFSDSLHEAPEASS